MIKKVWQSPGKNKFYWSDCIKAIFLLFFQGWQLLSWALRRCLQFVLWASGLGRSCSRNHLTKSSLLSNSSMLVVSRAYLLRPSWHPENELSVCCRYVVALFEYGAIGPCDSRCARLSAHLINQYVSLTYRPQFKNLVLVSLFYRVVFTLNKSDYIYNKKWTVDLLTDASHGPCPSLDSQIRRYPLTLLSTENGGIRRH